jgi:arginyl-tRNA synthetase
MYQPMDTPLSTQVRKILVEHSSPNLFKPFHIGHLMNNTIGEAITRLAKVSGAQVSTMSFPSDISLGVAKAIYALL